jgi:beta-lactamase superfamily II metal-dependent hydrolase
LKYNAQPDIIVLRREYMNRKTKQILGRVSSIALLAVLSLFINFYRNTPDSETPLETSKRADIVEVHFIDVGQGDAILIEANDATMLIDAGENNKGKVVADYLESQHITKLDYVIGTHPHSDHIGGMDTVLNEFEIDKIIMPSATHTTDTFEDLLDAIKENDLKITRAAVGDQYNLGSATFTIIAPNSPQYEDLNNYSVVIKLTFGNTSFLFTGDAGKMSEEEMLSSGIDLSADVLKLAHHGSAYSSSGAFLDAVNPTYAMINVGKDNDYGHPHAETLQAMLDRNIKVYRTDEQGTVVFTSDGKNISVNTHDYKILENDLKN